MSVLIVKAYAKVNFGLQVFPKREDGYHSLEGIFQTIDLYDELIVTENNIPGCRVKCNSLQLPQRNTITAAYDAFCNTFKNQVCVPGIEVELIKGIPAGGGLGGGSSDAAALVRALQKLCKVHLTEEQKNFIASETGSDVFFFIHSDESGLACAKVSGRGEIVEKIEPRKDLFLLLIFPACNSLTKEAYLSLDKFYLEGNFLKCPDYSELELIYKKSVRDWTFKNSFTKVIMNSIPEVQIALDDLKDNDCCFADMSGSGSTVFGVFTDEMQAKSVEKKLASKWNCKLVKVI